MTMWRGKLLYSVDEACSMLHMDQQTLHRLVRIGELGACCMDDRIGFSPQNLREYRDRAPAAVRGGT